jgi:hypothetical protein
MTRPPLELLDDAESVRFGDHRLELDRHASLRRIVLALADARTERRSLSVRELVAVGWPGEQMSAEAGKNRVYVAITKLRRLGLDAVLVRTPLGYALDPEVEVVRASTLQSSTLPLVRASAAGRLGDAVGDDAPKD